MDIVLLFQKKLPIYIYIYIYMNNITSQKEKVNIKTIKNDKIVKLP